ncbi:MAG TPA: hypothetical protein VF570_02190 [Pyrinomonadaceae bacterium]
MTPQDHNKVIGIMHLIYGGFNALMMLIFVPFFLLMAGFIRADPNAPPEVTAIFGFMGALMAFFALLFGVPPLLAGYAMLKRKGWAKKAGVIAACVEALSFPFGTALCVYTLWFLFGQGESFHRGGGDASAPNDWRGSLRDGSAYDWEAQRASQASRPREYTPPRQPPDWRG